MRTNLNDADETEGRRLYRAYADALAKAQISLARYKGKVSLRVSRSVGDNSRDTLIFL